MCSIQIKFVKSYQASIFSDSLNIQSEADSAAATNTFSMGYGPTDMPLNDVVSSSELISMPDDDLHSVSAIDDDIWIMFVKKSSIFTSKLRIWNLPSFQTIFDEIKQPVPTLISSALKDQLPTLLTDALKEYLPSILKDK
ncbi:hypothetical protein Tco_1358514 [Tanacetum coccineum]